MIGNYIIICRGCGSQEVHIKSGSFWCDCCQSRKELHEIQIAEVHERITPNGQDHPETADQTTKSGYT
jgi:uncharacterized Zn finger protein (UPF0148 family)